MPFVPRLLAQVLPAMSSTAEPLRQAAVRANTSLMEYISSLSEEPTGRNSTSPKTVSRVSTEKDLRRDSGPARSPQPGEKSGDGEGQAQTQTQSQELSQSKQIIPDLDYAAAVNALTLQFLNENEATRVGALTWLIMLHKKAPRKVGHHRYARNAWHQRSCLMRV